MNIFKLIGLYNRFESIQKEKAPMSSKLASYGSLIVSAAGTLGLPTLAANWVHSHLAVYAGLVLAAIILHAIMPSIFAAPSDADKKATGLSGVGVLLFCFLFSGMASAQTAPPPNPSNGLAGASEAVAIHYNGEWSAGTDITQSFDFLDFGAKKGSHLYLEGRQLLAPGPGFNIYAGGLKIEPDFSSLFSKTNLGALGNFSTYFSGAAGNGVPTVGGSHISFLAGAGVRYKLTSALTWQSLQVQYGQFGSNKFAVLSTGLSFIFTK